MGGIYGRSKVAKLIQEGNYDEAVAWATSMIERAAGDAETHVERAQAYAALGRHAEAARDLERAVALDAGAGDLDLDSLDDAYFTALLMVARRKAMTSPSEGADLLSRYAATFAPPRGQHHRDVEEWQRQLRGEVAAEVIVKER